MGHSRRVPAASARTVLLVEDHSLTRGPVQQGLETEGFRVVSLESSRFAIREFDGLDSDVLVADIELGEQPNGVDLASILRRQAPRLGVVFLTTYPSLDQVARGFARPARPSFVHKGSIDEPVPLAAEIAERRRGITLRSTERLVSRACTTLGLGDDSAINAGVAAVRMYVRAFGVPDSPRKRT